MNSITDLIRAQMAVTGRSYRDMEAISEKAGYKVRHQTFNDLANRGPEGFPRNVDTVRGIAAALDTTSEAVVLGYAVSLGLPIGERSSFELQLPRRVSDLDPQVANNLVSLIRSILEEGSGEHAGSTADKQAAGSAAPEFKSEVALAARRGTPDQAPDTDFEPA